MRQELEEKVMRYEQELGHDQIDNDIAKIFADEFKKDSESSVCIHTTTKISCFYIFSNKSALADVIMM